MRFRIALLVLTLASLACMEQIVTPSPAVSEAAPTPTAPTPTAAPSPVPSATEADAETATVRAAAVNIRSMPDGQEVVGQVVAGASVTLMAPCEDAWCRVWVELGNNEVIVGWIFQGCLSVAEEGQKCEAK